MWGRLGRQIKVAYYVVGFTWLFIILFVAITTGVHTKGSEHYMTPDGVSFYLLMLVQTERLTCTTVLVLDWRRARPLQKGTNWRRIF